MSNARGMPRGVGGGGGMLKLRFDWYINSTNSIYFVIMCHVNLIKNTHKLVMMSQKQNDTYSVWEIIILIIMCCKGVTNSLKLFVHFCTIEWSVVIDSLPQKGLPSIFSINLMTGEDNWCSLCSLAINSTTGTNCTEYPGMGGETFSIPINALHTPNTIFTALISLVFNNTGVSEDFWKIT